MKIAITATAPSLDGQVDPRFGRCQCFLIVDTDTLEFEAIENPNISLGGGAGIQSAQTMAEKGVQAVLTGNCGPNAHQTLSAADIKVIVGCSGSIKDAIEQFKAQKLSATDSPNVDSKFGVSNSSAGQQTQSMPGQGRGMGMGRGMGRGMGQGRGMGMGNSNMPQNVAEGLGNMDDPAELRKQAEQMAQQLADMQKRLKELEGGK